MELAARCDLETRDVLWVSATKGVNIDVLRDPGEGLAPSVTPPPPHLPAGPPAPSEGPAATARHLVQGPGHGVDQAGRLREAPGTGW